jgi:hypothetical protein
MFTGSARAAQYHKIGSGTDSCGTWTSARSTRTGWFQDSQWVLGFLSGFGYMGKRDGYDPLDGLDAEGVWAWVDNYCGTHPLEELSGAAEAFIVAHPFR